MSGTNEFLPFATGGGANVESQAAYAADANLPLGNQPGIANSKFNNKALRQACYIASQIAQFLVNQTGQSCLDDGTPANIQALMKQVWPCPTGAIIGFGASAAPVGFLNADGAAISRTTYAALFAVIGTTYGTGDGSTTFNLPDARGVFLRGSDTNGTLANASGSFYSATLGAGQVDQMQGHYHSVSDPGHHHGFGLTRSDMSVGGSSLTLNGGANNNTFSNTATVTTGITVSTAASDGTHGTPSVGFETRPANIGVNYIIKT